MRMIEMMQVLLTQVVSQFFLYSPTIGVRIERTDKNPRPKTTKRRAFCFLPLVRKLIREGIGMRKMTKSVAMFMAEERYQTGSTGRHRSFIDGTMEARGRQARASSRT